MQRLQTGTCVASSYVVHVAPVNRQVAILYDGRRLSRCRETNYPQIGHTYPQEENLPCTTSFTPIHRRKLSTYPQQSTGTYPQGVDCLALSTYPHPYMGFIHRCG